MSLHPLHSHSGIIELSDIRLGTPSRLVTGALARVYKRCAERPQHCPPVITCLSRAERGRSLAQAQRLPKEQQELVYVVLLLDAIGDAVDIDRTKHWLSQYGYAQANELVFVLMCLRDGAVERANVLESWPIELVLCLRAKHRALW